jgi:hypothetical protein
VPDWACRGRRFRRCSAVPSSRAQDAARRRRAVFTHRHPDLDGSRSPSRHSISVARRRVSGFDHHCRRPAPQLRSPSRSLLRPGWGGMRSLSRPREPTSMPSMGGTAGGAAITRTRKRQVQALRSAAARRPRNGAAPTRSSMARSACSTNTLSDTGASQPHRASSRCDRNRALVCLKCGALAEEPSRDAPMPRRSGGRAPGGAADRVVSGGP